VLISTASNIFPNSGCCSVAAVLVNSVVISSTGVRNSFILKVWAKKSVAVRFKARAHLSLQTKRIADDAARAWKEHGRFSSYQTEKFIFPLFIFEIIYRIHESNNNSETMVLNLNDFHKMMEHCELTPSIGDILN
jgi:hypothetical protein